VLVDAALGHAVGLRDDLADGGQPAERALYLVEVLNQLRSSMAWETSDEDNEPARDRMATPLSTAITFFTATPMAASRHPCARSAARSS
jgi:hypothetical protein